MFLGKTLILFSADVINLIPPTSLELALIDTREIFRSEVMEAFKYLLNFKQMNDPFDFIISFPYRAWGCCHDGY